MKAIWHVTFYLLALPVFGQETVERLDPKLDAIIAPGTVVETLCQGFLWAEGPVWDEREKRLLFSDVPRNTIFAWTEGMKDAREFMKPSGFTGVSDYGREAGSNGLAIDAKGQLVLCEHGDRRVSYLTPQGGKRTLTDHYQGKRFHSPNDLVIAKNGDIYFTDPPYGLPSKDQQKFRELEFHGVYRVGADGEAHLLTRELDRPNGVALSPDEKTLYVAQSHPPRAIIMAYPVKENGDLGAGKVFFDTKGLSGPGLPDGIKVHATGWVFSTGPGGVLILDDGGKLLGRVVCGRPTANVAFGPGQKSLFITSKDRVLRLPLR
jgi:gluconolactonase